MVYGLLLELLAWIPRTNYSSRRILKFAGFVTHPINLGDEKLNGQETERLVIHFDSPNSDPASLSQWAGSPLSSLLDRDDRIRRKFLWIQAVIPTSW